MITIFLCILNNVNVAQIQRNYNWHSSVYFGCHNGPMNGLNLGCSSILNQTIGIDARFSKGFFYEADLNMPVFFNSGKNQIYILPGYGYMRKGNPASYELQINSLRFGLGYKSEFHDRIYIDTRISLVKYLNELYNSSEISTIEKYSLNEKYYFELSISIGYCFYDNLMQKR